MIALTYAPPRAQCCAMPEQYAQSESSEEQGCVRVRLGAKGPYVPIMQQTFRARNITHVHAVLPPYPVIRVFSRSGQCIVDAEIQEITPDHQRLFVVYCSSDPKCERPQKWVNRTDVAGWNPGMDFEFSLEKDHKPDREETAADARTHTAAGILLAAGGIVAAAAGLFAIRGCISEPAQSHDVPAARTVTE